MIETPIEVKEALRSGIYRKNYRFIVYTEDGTADFVIDNSSLVSESVVFNEHMASTQKLKFGLCEGTSLEFQYFDFNNITGRRLEAYIDIEYKTQTGELSWHTMHMGWFTIKNCARNSRTGIIKASCYNKLMSDYLDADAKDEVKRIVAAGENGTTGSASVHKVLKTLLNDYSIEQQQFSTGGISITPSSAAEGVGGSGTYYISSGPYAGRYLGYCRVYYNLAPAGMTNSDYYKIVIDGQKLHEKLNEYLAPYLDCYFTFPGGAGTLRDNLKNANFCKFSGSDIYNLYSSKFGTLDEEKTYEIDYVTNGTVRIPLLAIFCWCGLKNGSEDYPTAAEFATAQTRYREIINECVEFRKLTLSPMEKFKITTANVESMTAGVTLRDLQSATFELQAQFGKLDRETDLFSGVHLNNQRLLPGEDEDHRPSETLLPKSTAENSSPAIYTDLFADEGDVHNFKYLIITYKGTDGQEKTLQRTVNTHGTDNYNMSSNWMFKNLPWTADQVGQYADAMVDLIKDVQWFPFEMDCCGLPYVEAGDEIEITINRETHTTYVLQRLLQGIQRLTDTYYNGIVNTF